MSTFYETPVRSDELYHYGRLGMKWYQHIFGQKDSKPVKRYKKEQFDKWDAADKNIKQVKKTGKASVRSARRDYREKKKEVNKYTEQLKNGEQVDANKASAAASDLKTSKSRLKEAKSQYKQNLKEAKAPVKEIKDNIKNAKKNVELQDKESNPSYLYQHRNEYTTQELNDKLNRINAEAKLHEAMTKDRQKGKKAADTVIGYGQTVSKALKTMQEINDNWDKWDGTIAGMDITGKKKYKHSRTMTEAEYRKLKSGN